MYKCCRKFVQGKEEMCRKFVQGEEDSAKLHNTATGDSFGPVGHCSPLL